MGLERVYDRKLIIEREQTDQEGRRNAKPEFISVSARYWWDRFIVGG